jgi:hypothetical protein
MKRIGIQIREGIKCIPKVYLAEALEVSPSTLNRWIEKGKISAPTGERNSFTRIDIEKILDELDFVPKVKFARYCKREWNIIKNGPLYLRSGCVFTRCYGEEGEDEVLDRLVGNNGLWNAQGGNNHEHMDTYIKNPVLQLVMSKELIEHWIEEVKRIKPKEKVIIFWDGEVDTTVCIYLKHIISDKFMREFDRREEGTELIVTEL